MVKKTEQDDFSLAERRRYDGIVQIQTMLADGYAPVQIKELLHTTYFRIRRYATGDPSKLCRFQGERKSGADRYKIRSLSYYRKTCSRSTYWSKLPGSAIVVSAQLSRHIAAS